MWGGVPQVFESARGGRGGCLISRSHPKGDDNEEHLEKGAEDNIICKGKRHDTQERGDGSEHNGGAYLSQGIGNTGIFRDIRVLRQMINDEVLRARMMPFTDDIGNCLRVGS